MKKLLNIFFYFARCWLSHLSTFMRGMMKEFWQKKMKTELWTNSIINLRTWTKWFFEHFWTLKVRFCTNLDKSSQSMLSKKLQEKLCEKAFSEINKRIKLISQTPSVIFGFFAPFGRRLRRFRKNCKSVCVSLERLSVACSVMSCKSIKKTSSESRPTWAGLILSVRKMMRRKKDEN